MTHDEDRLALAQLTRTVVNIEHLRVILKLYIDSLNGVKRSSEEGYISYAILERIYYNLTSSVALVKDLSFNHNVATPLSHIFRGIVYEIILIYWLLDKDFTNRLASANNDFVKKNYKRVQAEPNATPNRLRSLLEGWSTIAPENFVINKSDGSVEIKKVDVFRFDDACQYLLSVGYDIKSLVNAYYILSQQAHFSSFSRYAIYDKPLEHIGIFDAVVRHCILCCIQIVPVIHEDLNTVSKLNSLLVHYPKA